MTGAFVLSMWLLSAGLALDVADPYTVVLGPWILVSWAALLYALVPAFLLPKGAPPVTVADTIPVPPVAVAPTEAVSWSRTITSRLFVVMSILLAAYAAVVAVPPLVRDDLGVHSWTLIPTAVALLLVLVFCAYRVTVDWRGLRITSLLLGIPLTRITPADIARVDAAHLQPTDWGGWGYRIMPGRSALILRRGPGLVVTRTDGRQFAVSLDRPEEPAGILLHVMHRRGDETVGEQALLLPLVAYDGWNWWPTSWRALLAVAGLALAAGLVFAWLS